MIPSGQTVLTNRCQRARTSNEHHSESLARTPVLTLMPLASVATAMGTTFAILFLLHFAAVQVVIIVFFSIVGILGSYGVAWFGIRVNTFSMPCSSFKHGMITVIVCSLYIPAASP